MNVSDKKVSKFIQIRDKIRSSPFLSGLIVTTGIMSIVSAGIYGDIKNTKKKEFLAQTKTRTIECTQNFTKGEMIIEGYGKSFVSFTCEDNSTHKLMSPGMGFYDTVKNLKQGNEKIVLTIEEYINKKGIKSENVMIVETRKNKRIEVLDFIFDQVSDKYFEYVKTMKYSEKYQKLSNEYNLSNSFWRLDNLSEEDILVYEKSLMKMISMMDYKI